LENEPLTEVRRGKDHRFFYGYVIVAAAFCIQAIGIGTAISFGVFFKPLITEFGWSRAVLSGSQSLVFFFGSFLSIFIGRLNDRFGPRRIMAITGLFFGLGIMLMSQVETIWQLYLFYGVIFAIGFSSVDIVSLSTTAHWFRKRRGVMTGVVKVGTGTGQLIMPITTSLLIAGYGWSNAYLVIGITALILLIGIGQIMRLDPTQMGLLPDGETKSVASKEEEAEGGLSLREALRTKQLWIICAVNLFVLYCLTSIMMHIVPHAQDMGIQATTAAGILSTIGGVSMGGRFITGIAIDRIGNKRTMIVCYILLIAALIWLQGARELWMLYLFAVVYSLAHGGAFTVFSPIIAEHFGIKSHGTLFGITMFCGMIGGAIGPLVTGYSFDITGGYSLGFWLCVLVSIIGLVTLLWLRPIKEVASKISLHS